MTPPPPGGHKKLRVDEQKKRINRILESFIIRFYFAQIKSYFFTGAMSRILNESGFGERLGLGLSAVAAGAGLNSAVGA